MLRVDFEQHHVFRRMIPQHGAAERLAKILIRRSVDTVRLAIRPLQERLVCVQRRERLNLHQLRLKVGREAEIHLQKQWPRIFVEHPVFGRDRLFRARQILGRHQLMNQLRTVARHAVEQRARQKHRRLGIAKPDVRAASLVEQAQESRVFFRSEIRIKPLAEFANHFK